MNEERFAQDMRIGIAQGTHETYIHFFLAQNFHMKILHAKEFKALSVPDHLLKVGCNVDKAKAF